MPVSLAPRRANLLRHMLSCHPSPGLTHWPGKQIHRRNHESRPNHELEPQTSRSHLRRRMSSRLKYLFWAQSK